MRRFDPEQVCGLCGKRCRDHQDRVDHERECAKVNCNYCIENRGQMMMPPHFASLRCESGKRNHCTCDVCF